MLQIVINKVKDIFKLEKTFNSNHHYKVFEDAPRVSQSGFRTAFSFSRNQFRPPGPT